MYFQQQVHCTSNMAFNPYLPSPGFQAPLTNGKGTHQAAAQYHPPNQQSTGHS